eukprot:3890551-Pyramimonas_sp.AAC.1
MPQKRNVWSFADPPVITNVDATLSPSLSRCPFRSCLTRAYVEPQPCTSTTPYTSRPFFTRGLNCHYEDLQSKSKEKESRMKDLSKSATSFDQNVIESVRNVTCVSGFMQRVISPLLLLALFCLAGTAMGAASFNFEGKTITA